MPINPQGAQAIAAGQGQPVQPPSPVGQPQGIEPQPQSGGGQVQEIMNSLKQLLPQVVDQNGYVNMDRLLTMWPQVSQVPFQTVMQLIEQDPELLNQLVIQFGLAGIIAQGRVISAEELASAGSPGGV